MKAERGEYGYLKLRKKQALCHTLLMAGIGVVIFLLGLLLNKMEATNIFTVAAVLMVLPAAKSLVAVIVLAPYRETKKEDKERLDTYAMSGDTILYDVVFTSSEKVMHLTQVYVTGHQIIGISLRQKDDLKAATEYLEKELKARCLSYVVFLTKEESALKKRMALRKQETEGRSEQTEGKTKTGEMAENGAKQEVLTMLRTFTM
ncbi:MAG: hypothetical protein ACI4FZ_04420 [Lachnospiraceae bacterium]